MGNFTRFLGGKRNGMMKVMLVVVGMVWGVGAWGQTIETFNTSTTWTCPANVTSITVECWGGGGAGGSAKCGGQMIDYAIAGGGAGGAYVKKTISVTPGSTYTVTVGGSVSANSTATAANGNPSWFSSTSTVYAEGGAGGTGIIQNAGAGSQLGTKGTGSSASSIGDLIYAGGSGSNGYISSTQASGGGGGSAGTSSSGNTATTFTGATAVTGGGSGGSGQNGTEGVGNNGSSPGGGGGGALSKTTTTMRLGGSGAAGQVKLTYCNNFPTTISINGLTAVPFTSYPNIGDAITAMNSCGIIQPTILELTSNYFTSATGLETDDNATITLNNVNGQSATNTITIRPAAGVTGKTLSFSNTTAIFSFNGSDYWIIDGRPGGTASVSGYTDYLTIENTSTSTGGSAVQFSNDATYNTIRYCTLKSKFSSGSIGVVTFGTTTGTNGNDNNTIEYCNIDGGAEATASPTSGVAQSGVYSAGSTSTIGIQNSNNTISNNNIYNNFITGGSAANINNFGVVLSAGNTDWTITGNSFYQTSSRTGTTTGTAFTAYYGIYISNPTQGNNFTITDNYIGGRSASCGGSKFTVDGSANYFYGIFLNLGTTSATSVQNNTIANIQLTSNLSNVICFSGINISSGLATVGTTTGNTIGSTTANASTAGGASIAIIPTHATAATAPAVVGIYWTTTAAMDIRKNKVSGFNVTNFNPTAGANFYGIYGGAGSASSAIYNYTGNTIGSTTQVTNIVLGSGSTTSGIYTFNGLKAMTNTGVGTIKSNTIQNIITYGFGASTVIGIANTAGTTGTKINSNTISTLTLGTIGSDAASYIWGIHNTLAATVNIDSNIISACTLGNGYFRGIEDNVAATGTHSISSNTIGSSSVNNDISISSTTATVSMGINAASTGIYTINSNTIQNVSQSGAAEKNLYGIQIGSTGTYTVSGNTLNKLYSNSTGSYRSNVTGVNMSGDPNASTVIEKNKITNFKNTVSNGGFIYGIYSITASNLKAYNNYIECDNEGTSTDLLSIYGIYVEKTSNNISAHHNTIYISGTTGSNSQAFSYCLRHSASSATINIKNNLLINTRIDGGSSVTQGISFTSLTDATHDYNYYYVKDITLTSGGGTSSIYHRDGSNTQPTINSDGSLNANRLNIVGTGINLSATVSTDIIGTSRSTRPTKGCYEYPSFYSKTVNADATTLNNWNSNRDGISGTTPSSFLTANQKFIIQSGHTYKPTITWTGSATSTIIVESGGALDVNAQTLSTWQGIEIEGTGVLSSGAILNSSTTAATVTLPITLYAASSITSSGTGGLTLTGNIVNGGFLFTVSGAYATTISTGVISGTGGLTKTGNGTLTLFSVNTYSGITTISAGVINIQNANALGSTIGSTTVSSGAALEIQGGITTAAEPLSLSGTGITAASIQGGALRNISGANTYAGTITLAAVSRINSDLGTLTLSNAASIGGSSINVTFGGVSNIIVSGTILTGAATVTKDGTGTLTLSGNSTYTGLTTVSAGTLKLGGTGVDNNSSPLGVSSGGIIVSSGASLDLNGYSLLTSESLTINGVGVNSAGALTNSSTSPALWYGNIVLNDATSNYIGTSGNALTGTITISPNGAISGANPLQIVNTGATTKSSVIIATSNSYTGATSIISGTLKLSGAGSISTSSSISIASEATFDVSAKTANVAFGASQILSIPTTGTNTTSYLTVASDDGVTMGGAAGRITFSAYGGANGSSATNAPLTVTGISAGALALNNTPVTVTTSSTLATGRYVLIAKAGTATGVIGTPGALTISGVGLAPNTSSSLTVENSQLILNVCSTNTTTYYVATNGSDDINNGTSSLTPFATLQKAINMSCGSNPILINVAAGSYTEKNIIISNKNNITITGAGMASTIFNPASSTDRFMTISGTSTGISITGIKIQNYQAPNGEYQGGGFNITTSGAAVTLTSVHVDDCIIASASGSLGGGGIYISSSSTVTISKSKFTNNLSSSGGNITMDGASIFSQGALTLVNSLFYDNTSTSTHDGDFAMNAGTTTITNCTFIYNANSVIPVYCNGGTLNIYNSILNGSTSTNSIVKANGTVNVYNSIYTSGTAIGGVTFTTCTTASDVGYAFTNRSTKDYSITASSPCINYGTTSGAPSDDFIGISRTGNPDVGCYEAPVSVFYSRYNTLNTMSNETSNWSSNRNGTGSQPTSFTTAGQTFIIQNSHQYQAGTNWIGSSTSVIQVESGGALDLNGANAALMGTTSNWQKIDLSGSGISTGALFNSSSTAASLAIPITLTSNATATSFGSGNLTLSENITTAGYTLTVNGTNNTTLSGIISGTGSVTKSGTGILTLSGTNTHTGGTTVSAGTLAIGNNSGLGTGTLNISGGSLDASGADRTITNVMTISGSFTYTGSSYNLTQHTGAVGLTSDPIITVSNNNFTINGVISNSGTTQETFTTPGDFNWPRPNGVTTATVYCWGAGGGGYASGQYSGQTAGSGGGGGGGLSYSNLSNLSLNSYNYSVGQGGTAGTCTKSGGCTSAGTCTYTFVTPGSGGSTFFGNTNSGASSGSLVSANGGGGGASSSGGSGGSGSSFSGGSGGTGSSSSLACASGSDTYGGGGGGGAGTLSNGGNTSNPCSGSGGSGTYVGGNGAAGRFNSGANGSQPGGGGSGASSRSSAAQNGGSGGSGQIVIEYSTPRSLSKNGIGTLTLGGTNTFTKGFTLTAGTLNINNVSALGATSGTFTINGGTINNTSGGVITMNSYPMSWAGDFTFTGSNELNMGTGATAMTATRQVTISASTLTVGGIISGSTFGLTKLGTGTMTLSGVNTYTSTTTVSAGTLALSGSGSIASTSNIIVATAANMDVSAKTSGISLTSSQTLTVSATGSNTTASITVASSKDYTLGSSGTLTFSNYGGGATPPLTITGSTAGAFLMNGAPVTVTTSTALGAGTYILVDKASSATGVTGSPGTLTIGGSGLGTNCTATISVTANQLVLIVVGPTITLGSNPVAVASSCASTSKVPIQSFTLAVNGGSGNLTKVNFTTTGSYIEADLTNYKLWYGTDNDLNHVNTTLITTLNSSGNAGNKEFTAFTSPNLTSGSTYYFWITMDVASSAINNKTIEVNAISTIDLTSTSTKAGTTSAGGTQTLKATSVPTGTASQSFCSSSSPTVASLSATGTSIQWYSVANGGTALPSNTALIDGTHYYATQSESSCESTTRFDVTATVNTVSISGTAASSQSIVSGNSPADISLSSNTGSIHWEYSDNNSSYTSIGSATSATLSSADMGTLNATRYYRAVVTNGMCASATSNVITITVTSANATITLGSNPVGSASICASSAKVPIQSFSLAVTNGAGNLTNVGFTTTGNYAESDISHYQLYYGTTNSLGSATQLGSDLSSSGVAGVRMFSTFTSPVLNNNTTYYFWITADVASGATNNTTIGVNAITTSNLSTTSNTAGTTSAGGIQTLKAIPTSSEAGANQTSPVICGLSEVTLNGNNPTVGTGTWTIQSGTNGSLTSASTYNTTFNGKLGQTYLLRWTISNGSCASTKDSVTISFITPKNTTPATGDYVWKGNTNTWSTAGNWLYYDGTKYTPAGSIPTSSNRVIIAAKNNCASTNPTLTADISIGSLVIETGATFNQSSYTTTISGDFTNDGTFNAGTGTTTFTGTGTISGATTFHNLTINGATTFASSQVVNNELTLGNKITLGANNLTIGSSGSITGYNASNYIVTNSTGKLKRSDIGVGGATGQIIFPVGIVASYTPIILENTGTKDDFSVYVGEHRYADGYATGASRMHAVDRTWFVEEGTPSGSNVEMTIQWNAGEELSFNGTNAFNRLNCFISHYTGGAWDRQTGGAASGSGPYTISRDSITSFSPFSVEDPQALPITLIDFTAKAEEKKVRLDWETGTEDNNDYFTIERSLDGKTFEKVFTKDGAGNSKTNLYYFGYDASPYTGVSYYRLKQTDFDGKFAYSDIVSVKVAGEKTTSETQVSAYPNPVINQLIHVDIHTKNNDKYSLKFINEIGQQVFTESYDAFVGTNNYEIQLPNVTPGMYILEITNEQNIVVEHLKITIN